MVRNENSDISLEKNHVEENSSERKYDVINYLTYDFVLESVHNLEKTNNHLLSISYNNRQKMFIMLDPLGLVTWEWRKINNSTKRVLSYPDFEYRHIIDVIYCKNHNCYFALKGDYTLIVLNRDFLEICTAGDNMRSILCMNYNTVTDELITCGLEGVKVWCLKSTTEEQWKSTKPMASYRLVLKKEMNWIKDWIKRIEVDIVNCHLYCCTRTELYIYDFEGSLIRVYKGCHRLAITTCVYSPNAKVVLTGSEDADIKVWSLAGGQIETFRGHTRVVTNLVLNPHNENLVISSSLDGTIKMWSLDIMQLIYELNYFDEHVIWMGVTEDKLLYAATPSKITMWSINNFVDFWSLSRNRVNKIQLASYQGKSTRIIACSEDNTVRLFNRDTTRALTTILPVPKANAATIHSVTYSRHYNILYMLLNDNEIWLYYTKTNPATHIIVWNALKLQENKVSTENDAENNLKKTFIKPPKPIQLTTQNLLLNYRAIEYGLLIHEKPQECRCICVLESPVLFYNEEGPCCPIVKTFLLLGLQNGKIFFCDAFLESKKYFVFHCNKDPVVNMYQDQYYNSLVTTVELKSLYCIQYWSLPNLELQKEFYCSSQMTCFARIDDFVMAGFDDGSVDFIELKTVIDSSIKTQTLSDSDVDAILNKNLRFEHKEKVGNIDACQNLKLFVVAVISQEYLRNDKTIDANDSEPLLSDDSSIIEDPSLKVSTYNDEPDVVTLDTYLYPFNLNLKTDDWINSEKQKKKTETKSIRYDQLDETSESSISTIPPSLYSTPRTPQNFFPNIDLTLNSQVRKNDIKNYLIEIFSKSLKNKSSSTWNFPKFGESPMSTPSCTPRSASEESRVAVDETEKTNDKITTKDQGTETIPELLTEITEIKKIKTLKKAIDEEEMERKLRERMPIQFKPSDLKYTKIDSKKLINQGLPPNLNNRQPAKDTRPPLQRFDSKYISKRTVKKTKKPKQKQALPVKEYKLNTDDGDNKDRQRRFSRSPSFKSINLHDYQDTKPRRKRDSLTNLDRKRSIIKTSSNSNELDDSYSEGDSEVYNEVKARLEKFDTGTHEPKIKQVFNSPINSPDTLIKNSPLTTSMETKLHTIEPKNELVNTNNSPQHRSLKTARIFSSSVLSNLKKEIQDVTSELRNIESIEPPDDEHSNKIYKKRLGTQTRDTHTPQSIPLSQLDTNFSDIWESFSKRKLKARGQIKPQTKKIEYTEGELEQITNLFSYYYGLNGPPKRINSANYKLDENNNDNKSVGQKDNKTLDTKKDMVKVDHLKKIQDANQTVFQYFDKILEKYENQRYKSNERAKSAQIRRDNLLDDSLKKWSESIEKKNKTKGVEFENNFLNKSLRPLSSGIKIVDVTFGDRSLLNREVKSASILSKRDNLSKKRPKSVTFSNNINNVKSISEHTSGNFETNNTNKNDDKKNVLEIHVPPYLISAIEMEEILEEAASRAASRSTTRVNTNRQTSRSQTSITKVPSVYYKYLKVLKKNNKLSHKKTFDANQESMDQIYTISGTASSDEYDSDIDYDMFFQKNDRSSNLSTTHKTTPNSLDTQHKFQGSNRKNLRINSCIADYRTTPNKFIIKDTSKFESLSSYRISFKSISINDPKSKPRNRSYYSKGENNLSENEHDDEFRESSTYSKYRLENASPDGLHDHKREKNNRTPSSIPSKCRKYKLVKRPEIKLKYKIPGYPECYLLPVRFPKLHSKIISDLLKIKTAKHFQKIL